MAGDALFPTALKKESNRTETKGDKMSNEVNIEQWLGVRKQAGLEIDPATAEVDWEFAQVADPYGIYPDLPEECQQVGRAYFARSPGSDIWVHFSDLPDETRNALWELHKTKLAFPVGLDLSD
jgi:hypothetical protein